ncbi:hypothetical protein BJ165DRAFT_1476619 [Panaeolus papilionaceus]|nr:hypothetical protein BJ165DRAFT_1476619 [Panaeolus papilionaceus]
MAKARKTKDKNEVTLQDSVKQGSKRKEQISKSRTRTKARKVSTSCTSHGGSSDLDTHEVNSRGLPALPDELLLEILLYLPCVPKVTSSLERDSRWVRREVLLSFSLLCKNLRRFALPFIFETIEVYTGTRVARCTKGRSVILGGSKDSYGVSKEFAVELLHQLHFVTIKIPELRFKVRAILVELRGHRLEEVSEELFRCLPLFPNLSTIQLAINLPTSFYDVRRSNSQIDPTLFAELSLPSVHTLIVDSLPDFVSICPNVKHVHFCARFGINPYATLSDQQRLRIETLYVKYQYATLTTFPNLRKLILHDKNLALGANILIILQPPGLPRLQTLHVVVDFHVGRKTEAITRRLEGFTERPRMRQALIQEDKFICFEYRIPKLKREYVLLKADGTRETDAKWIRDMF